MDPEDPVPFAMSGQMLGELPAAAIDAIVEAAGPDSGSLLLSLELRLLGGALTQAPPDAGALASLDHAFLTLGVGMVMDPDMASAINGHGRRVVPARRKQHDPRGVDPAPSREDEHAIAYRTA
jgi:hypothetical protein